MARFIHPALEAMSQEEREAMRDAEVARREARKAAREAAAFAPSPAASTHHGKGYSRRTIVLAANANRIGTQANGLTLTGYGQSWTFSQRNWDSNGNSSVVPVDFIGKEVCYAYWA